MPVLISLVEITKRLLTTTTTTTFEIAKVANFHCPEVDATGCDWKRIPEVASAWPVIDAQ